jgi:acyl carrier protein
MTAIDIIVKQFLIEEFAPDLTVADLDPDFDLLEGGIVDSLGLLVVIAWIEDRFSLAIDTAEVVEGDFRSVRSICSLIDSSAGVLGPEQH